METLQQQNIELKAELDNMQTMMAEIKEKQEKDDTMKTIKEDVLSLTKKLTEMNKNQEETKEELKKLKANNCKINENCEKREQKVMSNLTTKLNNLAEIQRADSKKNHEEQNAWMLMNIDESRKQTREVDVRHCEKNNHNMDVMKREMAKLNIIQKTLWENLMKNKDLPKKTLWENLMKNKDFPTGQILCFGASKSNPSKDN